MRADSRRPRLTPLAGGAVLAAIALAAACSDSTRPSASPTVTGAAAPGTPQAATAGLSTKTVVALDDCDPASFNAALGAGTCVGNGTTTLSQFLAELSLTQNAAKWRFHPFHVGALAGEDVQGINQGGEVHTFTPVKQFGGGIVQLLNDATGNFHPAAECTALEPDDFVPPGGHYTIESSELLAVANGTRARVQCCIHPWMRMEVDFDAIGASLVPGDEVPPTTSHASATVRFRFVNPTTIELIAEVTNPAGETFVAAHIHRGPPGVAGPIVVPLFSGSDNSPHLEVKGTFVISDPALAASIENHPELFYVNFHTTVFPSGAIRGQLAPLATP